MPAQVIYKGPTPPIGERWCFVCAYEWKNAVNEAHQADIEAAATAPEGTLVVIDGTQVEGVPTPAVAVAQGINGSLMQFGVLDLCWSHVTAIQLKTASGIHLPPPGAGLPPGMNGFGG